MERGRSMVLALAGGLLTTLSVPPFGWWPLGIVGLGVFSLSLRDAGTRRRVTCGLLFGVGLYGISLWWMAQFTLPGAIFVAVLESVITAAAMAALPRRNAHVFAPAGLVLADCLRSLWPFGGLPLGGIDLGQAGGPLAPSVGFGGRLLLVGLAATAGVALVHLRRRAAQVAAVTVMLVAVAVNVAPNGTHGTGDTRRIGVVQGGGPRGQLASTANAKRTYQAHLAMTRTLQPADRLDAVLWPENTVDVAKLTTSTEATTLQAEAERIGAPLLIGFTEDIDDRSLVNAHATIDPMLGVTDVFEKVRRVPYGEYFPFRSVIGKLAELPPRDFRPGTKPGVLSTGKDHFAIAISYEGFFDDRTRGGVRAGGIAVLIPTNASSYVTMQVPTQQIAAARLRALETGRWAVQAGPTGLSAVIDSDGGVRWRSVVERAETHVAELDARAGWTPYVRFNDAPALVLLVLALVVAQLVARKPPPSSTASRWKRGFFFEL